MGDQFGTKTVTVDKKEKSFKFSRVNDWGFVETIGLNFYPSNNIFEGFLCTYLGTLTTGFAGAGITDVDEGITIGGENAFNERYGRPFRFVVQGSPVVFVGSKQ